jgi:hypothetical protein
MFSLIVRLYFDTVISVSNEPQPSTRRDTSQVSRLKKRKEK